MTEKKERFIVMIIDGESFPVDADRIEDDDTKGLYKVYLTGNLQGVFNKSDVQGYLWDYVRECGHES